MVLTATMAGDNEAGRARPVVATPATAIVNTVLAVLHTSEFLGAETETLPKTEATDQ